MFVRCRSYAWVMRPASRGNSGEAALLSALVKRGFDVLLPFGDGHPYDLVIRTPGNSYVRVQCKTAWPAGGCLIFNCHATDHGQGPLPYSGLADIFGVYFPPNDSVYLVPVNAVGENEGRLRLEPARNNQRRRVRLAVDYAIDRWTPEALHNMMPGANSVAASVKPAALGI
jgi:hypothetical protein